MAEKTSKGNKASLAMGKLGCDGEGHEKDMRRRRCVTAVHELFHTDPHCKTAFYGKIQRMELFFFLQFIALYHFGLWVSHSCFSLGRKTRCILFAHVFAVQLSRREGSKDDEFVYFFFWLVYEVYKGNDGHLFSTASGMRGASITRQTEMFGMVWIKK